MRNPLQTRFTELPAGDRRWVFFSFFFLLLASVTGFAQDLPKTFEDTVSFDTIVVKKGTWFHFEGKTYKIRKDTVFVVTTYEVPTIEVKSELRTTSFYDSVYKKLTRKKLSKMLYSMAFREPEPPPLPGNSNQVKSEVPFKQYQGKVIRHIRIVTLSPFGPSVYDTLSEARTGAGEALNAAHMNTRAFVIRKNLFIREGQKVDPFLLADNERNIREMSFIDNVRTCVSMPDSTSDSLDITIITKDVWSIGFDVTTATTNRATFRLYDGNFLGLGDRLSTNYSIKTNRQPFFRLDGASYSYNNISGTFLNTLLTYSLDDEGNYNMGVALNRNFYSINTKWAFGAGYQYTKMVTERESIMEQKIPPDISYFSDVNLWGGRSFRIKKATIPTRLVISESFYNRSFSSRPAVYLDSNKAYYNTYRVLTGFAFSSNSSYLSDYILQFGKLENVPYGKLIQFTLGPEFNDFYTRYYAGLDLSAGDFIDGLGYLSGKAVLAGYLDNRSFEDCVLKLSLKYMTPLFVTPDKKFRVRGYLFSDYRTGFNFRKNNTDYSDINHDLLIDQVKVDTVFHGMTSLSSTLAVVLYTPLYFYGFKFAFKIQGKGGFVADQGQDLLHRPFYTGVGFGILIRNDNLIFPSILLSMTYYPFVPQGVPWWQFRFDQNADIPLPDYNVSVPHVENLQN
jgi:hypothetical protein